MNNKKVSDITRIESDLFLIEDLNTATLDLGDKNTYPINIRFKH